MKEYFSRFFPLAIVGEGFTSQKCPKCYQQLEMHGKKGVRVKQCNHGCVRGCGDGGGQGEPFVINRDISAPMNMLTIVLCMVLFGERPLAFQQRH
jgi:hypothetical protein